MHLWTEYFELEYQPLKICDKGSQDQFLSDQKLNSKNIPASWVLVRDASAADGKWFKALLLALESIIAGRHREISCFLQNS